ncbi:chloride channel protein CLC-c-like [Senna tora]|uniref:dynamin GTPase n=1 Tax=Senna tora TaxID=362788 RepID=A0A834XDZ2_9FABA|nr:chloride channel protein CLC-c-like [Senna tora]
MQDWKSRKKVELYQYLALKWTLALLIGLITGLVAFFNNLAVENISGFKLLLTDNLMLKHKYLQAFALYAGCNLILATAAAALCAYVAPAAAGSGIPEVKAYLNGVDAYSILAPSTFFVKIFGLIFGIAAGFFVGKEGPMVHTGACIANLLGQGGSKKYGLTWRMLRYLKNDRDRRDLITCGAAAGVAGAFRAPVGGVLFALEEAASWWRSALLWRTFFTTAVVAVVLKGFVQLCRGGKCGLFGEGGLIMFDVSSETPVYSMPDFLVVILLGVIGGLLGSLYNHLINKVLRTYAAINERGPIFKILLVVIISLLTSCVSYGIPWLSKCIPCPPDSNGGCPIIGRSKNYKSFQCPPNHYNDLASLFFTPNDDAIRNLFTSGSNKEFQLSTLLTYFVAVYILGIITYGIAIPSGLFIPVILAGASYGRLASRLFSAFTDLDVGLFAVIGAASFLGGTMRMTVSICVILLELTNNLLMLPLVMLVLLISKTVADNFNPGIYDQIVKLKGLPFLEADAEPYMRHLTASDVVSGPLFSFSGVEKVRNIVHALKVTHHHGFPVINEPPFSESPELCGLVYRSHLLVLLKERKFTQQKVMTGSTIMRSFEAHDFAKPGLGKGIKLEDFYIKEEEMEMYVDLHPVTNTSPYTVVETMSLAKAAVLFRQLGLRHLLVVPKTTGSHHFSSYFARFAGDLLRRVTLTSSAVRSIHPLLRVSWFLSLREDLKSELRYWFDDFAFSLSLSLCWSIVCKSMEAIEELVQLSDSMRQAAAVLADEDVDEKTPSRRPSTFLNVVALGNVVAGSDLEVVSCGLDKSSQVAYLSDLQFMVHSMRCSFGLWINSEGAGKSAVLNSLIGHPVLPTGENGATRAPISIELNRDSSLSSKSIILQIENKSQQVSASALRHSLQDRLSKGSSGRSRDEIYLKLRTRYFCTPAYAMGYHSFMPLCCSAQAPPLKLIDLPGLDQRITDDKMISEYIEHNDAILLVVVPAAQASEISSSRALRVAKEYDAESTRTVGVISKIDQAATESKAIAAVQALLLNQGPPKTSDIPWIAIIGQSVSIASAQSGSAGSENSLETAWRAETESLKSILTGAPQNKLGRIALVESLAGQIRNRMKLRLPTLLSGLQGKSQIVQDELVKLGEQMVSSPEGTRALALELCREFEDKFLLHLTGGEGNGWKVVASFEGNFPNRIKQLPIDRHFDINNVKRIVLEADGYQPYLISPEKGLRSLIKGVLELAKEPSRLCVDEVHRVLLDIVSSAANATPGLGRYPPFKREIVAIASSALDTFKNESKKMVVALVDMERAFVPPQHFIRLVQRRDCSVGVFKYLNSFSIISFVKILHFFQLFRFPILLINDQLDRTLERERLHLAEMSSGSPMIMERQRREDELKNRSSKKAPEAEQSSLNRAASPQTGQQSGGSLKSMKDKSGQPDKDTQEGSGLKTAGPDGEITAGYLFKKSGKTNGWSKRWFVLNEKTGKLGYTKKQEERHFRGVITLEECNIEETSDDDEAPAKSSKDKKANGPDSAKAPNLTFKLTSKVAYKTVMKAQSTVVLKAESAADKVEWLKKLRNVANPTKGGQVISESGFPMRQSLSDGSLDTMARRPADPEEELRWMSQEVRGYVEAVLNSLAANVPKAVVLCQVEKAKEDMLNQLYSSISAQSSAKIEELLQEDHNVKRRRDRIQKQSSILSKLTRQLSIHDNKVAAASNWSDGGAESSPRSSGPSPASDWRSAFDAAANGPIDSSSRFGSGGHSRRNSDPSQNGDTNSGSNSSSRRTPNRMPPAPPPSGSRN